MHQMDVVGNSRYHNQTNERFKIRAEFSPNYTYIYNEDQRTKISAINGAIELILSNIQYVNGFSATDYIQNRYDKRFYYVFNAYADYTFEPENFLIILMQLLDLTKKKVRDII